MPSNDESFHVSVQDAREHAVLTVVQAAIAGVPDIVERLKASLRKDPVVISDLNGQELFYDFELLLAAQSIGYVRVAANQLVGSPGVAIEIGPRSWDFDRAVKKVSSAARRDLGQPGSPKLVCYSYPKLGVMFNSGDTKNPVVYDVASFDRIPPLRGDAEGAFAWSFLDSIPDRERPARLKRYRAYDQARSEVSPALLKRMVAARSIGAAVDVSEFVKVRSTKTRKLQYCPHYNETEARSHHCFSLHAQQVNDYCAVATCQMVLCYYRYYYSQDEIAPRLGYSPGGGCPADQSGGYENLTCNHLDAAFDSSPTFNKARTEIDALHPFKTGIPGHARACAGYSFTTWLFAAGTTDRKLYIYDPWPWNADLKLGGAVYWEDWDAITHTNYVTTRVNCP